MYAHLIRPPRGAAVSVDETELRNVNFLFAAAPQLHELKSQLNGSLRMHRVEDERPSACRRDVRQRCRGGPEEQQEYTCPFDPETNNALKESACKELRVVEGSGGENPLQAPTT